MKHPHAAMKRLTGRTFGFIPAGLAGLLICFQSYAQVPAAPGDHGFTTVQEILKQADTVSEGIPEPSRDSPGDAQVAASDSTGDTTPDAVSGATETDTGGTVADGVEAVSGATPVRETGRLTRTVNFHRIAGYTSAGLLLAADLVGTIKIFSFMDEGHRYRESLDVDEPGALCAAKIHDMWGESDQQALRWTHIGLLVAGNGLYLSDAVTGLLFPRATNENVTVRRIHRYAFYVHAALMVTEMILGFATTSALEHGSHEQVLNLAIAHGAVGLAAPLAIIGSGVAIDLTRKKFP